MNVLTVCRSCGSRKSADLAANELELVQVGMLEQRCERCAASTRWGRAEDYRRADRRAVPERRRVPIRKRDRREYARAGADRRRRVRRAGTPRRVGARRRV